MKERDHEEGPENIQLNPDASTRQRADWLWKFAEKQIKEGNVGEGTETHQNPLDTTQQITLDETQQMTLGETQPISEEKINTDLEAIQNIFGLSDQIGDPKVAQQIIMYLGDLSEEAKAAVAQFWYEEKIETQDPETQELFAKNKKNLTKIAAISGQQAAQITNILSQLENLGYTEQIKLIFTPYLPTPQQEQNQPIPEQDLRDSYNFVIENLKTPQGIKALNDILNRVKAGFSIPENYFERFFNDTSMATASKDIEEINIKEGMRKEAEITNDGILQVIRDFVLPTIQTQPQQSQPKQESQNQSVEEVPDASPSVTMEELKQATNLFSGISEQIQLVMDRMQSYVQYMPDVFGETYSYMTDVFNQFEISKNQLLSDLQNKVTAGSDSWIVVAQGEMGFTAPHKTTGWGIPDLLPGRGKRSQQRLTDQFTQDIHALNNSIRKSYGLEIARNPAFGDLFRLLNGLSTSVNTVLQNITSEGLSQGALSNRDMLMNMLQPYQLEQEELQDQQQMQPQPAVQNINQALNSLEQNIFQNENLKRNPKIWEAIGTIKKQMGEE